MKVCILSMQRIPNFGSLLQCYSLQKMLETLGHEVSFIDILKNEQDDSLLCGNRQRFICEAEETGGLRNKLRKIDVYAFNRLHIKKMAKQQSREFEAFRTNSLHLSDGDNHSNYDVCVIGSDEVFNCLSPSPWGFTSQLFGNVPQACKVITYAASCGSTTYDDLPGPVAGRIRETFNNLSAFSVRDRNTEEFVRCLTEQKPKLHLDPVAIGLFDQEISSCQLPKNLPEHYCVVYSYYNRIHEQSEIRPIQKFCREKGLKIVSVGAPQMWIRNHLVLSPFEALAVFQNADFVITDTFHGTIFAAKYAKRLAVLARPSNRNKLVDLIHRLHLENHLIKQIQDIPAVYECEKNQKAIEERLKEERERTLAYLEQNI